MDKSCLGIESLTKRLVNLLTVRIKDALPNMKWELQESLGELRSGLATSKWMGKVSSRRFPRRMQQNLPLSRRSRATNEGPKTVDQWLVEALSTPKAWEEIYWANFDMGAVAT